MNTPYNQLSAADAANMLGVDYSTVTDWCNRGLINFINVGEGPNKNRYVIEEGEVRYIKKLIQQHGVRKMLLNYKKDWRETSKAYTPEPVGVQRTFDVYDEDEDANVIPETIEPDGFDPNKLLNTIIYIRDIKKKLKDLEQEKALLQEELKKCTEEVKSFID